MSLENPENIEEFLEFEREFCRRLQIAGPEEREWMYNRCHQDTIKMDNGECTRYGINEVWPAAKKIFDTEGMKLT